MATTLQLSFETFTFQIVIFLLKGRTVTFEKSLSADVVHFRASRSETCLSLLMALSFSNC